MPASTAKDTPPAAPTGNSLAKEPALAIARSAAPAREREDAHKEAPSSERLKAIETAMSAIEKQFGKGSIMKLGDNARMRVATIPTGVLPLDVALGVGGLPRGRVVEIYGPESGGKTTVSLQVVAQIQRSGGIAAFIDAEHALDPVYARNLGVDIDNLLVSQPDTGEQALEIVDT
ncbi:MAG: hypothetical protein KGR26_06910, partial [Cyanobacteria bacterium REEB65]|nr:hypothetical protein [Cyanobacteria bacterium REEB65]